MTPPTPVSKKQRVDRSKSPEYAGPSPKLQALLNRKRNQENASNGDDRSQLSDNTRITRSQALQVEMKRKRDLEDALARVKLSMNQDGGSDRTNPVDPSNGVVLSPKAQFLANRDDKEHALVFAYGRYEPVYTLEDANTNSAPFANLAIRKTDLNPLNIIEKPFEVMGFLLPAYKRLIAERNQEPKTPNAIGDDGQLSYAEEADNFWVAAMKFMEDSSKCAITRRIVMDEATKGLAMEFDLFGKPGEHKNNYQETIQFSNKAWQHVFKNAPEEFSTTIAKFFLSSPKAIETQTILDLMEATIMKTVPTAEHAKFIGERAANKCRFREIIDMPAKAPFVAAMQRVMHICYPIHRPVELEVDINADW